MDHSCRERPTKFWKFKVILHLAHVHFDQFIDSLWTLEKNETIEEISFNFIRAQEFFAPTIATMFKVDLLPNIKVICFVGFPKRALEKFCWRFNQLLKN
jgi:hypothetical protein